MAAATTYADLTTREAKRKKTSWHPSFGKGVRYHAVVGRELEPTTDGAGFFVTEDLEADPYPYPRELVLVQNFAEELKCLVPTDE